jgi:hypothetical protein
MTIKTVLRALTAAVLAGASALAVAPSAQASLVETAACDDAPLSRPFARWGDLAHYKLAPGGDIEGDLAGWTLAGGARRVAGGEPWNVTGVQGRQALSLPAGASVTTPATCVNAAYPTIRFFARSSGGLLGLLPLLKVDLVYRDGALGLVSVPAGTVVPNGSWQPTLPMLTLSAVGAAVAGGEAPLAIRFTSVSGTWQVDDVFVDPWRRG